MRLQFGDFVLDTDRRVLECSGRPVHVSAKAFSLLAVLVLERPRAISKRELLDRVWPEVVVAAENVKNLISELRTALDDRRSQSLIRTVHGFGYAFAAEAREQPADAIAVRYWLHYDAQVLPIRTAVTDLGRDQQCGICIDAPSVSRRHARIVITDSDVSLHDLGSKNGTRIGRMLIKSAVPLHNGDRIQLGSITLTFRTNAAAESTISESTRD